MTENQWRSWLRIKLQAMMARSAKAKGGKYVHKSEFIQANLEEIAKHSMRLKPKTNVSIKRAGSKADRS